MIRCRDCDVRPAPHELDSGICELCGKPLYDFAPRNGNARPVVRDREPTLDQDEPTYTPESHDRTRSTAVTVVGVLYLFWAVIFLIVGGVVVAGVHRFEAEVQEAREQAQQALKAGKKPPPQPLAGFGVLCVGLGVVLYALAFLSAAAHGLAGLGVLRRNQWGRVLAIVMAVLAILCGPQFVAGEVTASSLAVGGAVVAQGVLVIVILYKYRAEFSGRA